MAHKVYFPHKEEIVSKPLRVVALCCVFFMCDNIPKERAVSNIKSKVIFILFY